MNRVKLKTENDVYIISCFVLLFSNSALRSCVYEVLTVWLKLMDGCSGFVHEEKLIIKELLHDLTPEKEVLKVCLYMHKDHAENKS